MTVILVGVALLAGGAALLIRWWMRDDKNWTEHTRGNRDN